MYFKTFSIILRHMHVLYQIRRRVFIRNNFVIKHYEAEQLVTFHSLTQPSSLHEANKPATHGFQLSPFTSNVSALAAALNDSWSASPDNWSSANIRMQSSPPADAISPVNRHLIKQIYSVFSAGNRGFRISIALCLRP